MQLPFSSCHFRLQFPVQGLDLVQIFSSRLQVDVDDLLGLLLLHVLRRRLRDILVPSSSHFDGLLPLLDELLALGVEHPKLLGGAV